MPRAFVLILLMAGSALPCSPVFRKAIYSKHPGSESALFRFERNGKVGFIDASGHEVIPPRFVPGFHAEEDFFEGLSPAQAEENRWGFINEQGQWVIQPQYWRVDFFYEGLAAVTPVEPNLPMSYIDKTGKTVIYLSNDVVSAGRFSEGIARIAVYGYSSFGKVGYIDTSGRIAIRPDLAVGGDFHSGLARVVLDGQCYVLTEKYSRAAPPSAPMATNCGGGVSDSIKVRCREGFIDKSGTLRFEFEGTRDFSEGLAAVLVNGKWGYIDPTGALVVPPSFDEAQQFSEGLAAVRLGKSWGYIDPRGNGVIPPLFLQADPFSNGVAKVQGGYIDKTGRPILPELNGGTAFTQGLAHVTLGVDHYGYVDKSGKTIFEYRAPGATRL